MRAPRELTQAFRDGVDEREAVAYLDEGEIGCWLAQFDRGERPCEGRFERFHFLSRQRVEHALEAVLPIHEDDLDQGYSPHSPRACALTRHLVHLAAWDCRNGGIACEAHHRRFDKHLVSLPSEQIVVPLDALPEHVHEFANDWGLEDELEAKFPELEAVQ